MSKQSNNQPSPLANTERNKKIAERREKGETLTAIAKDYGLSVTRVSRIVNNFYEKLPKSSTKTNRVSRKTPTAAAAA